MSTGIYSRKHNTRFWHVAIPKTGSQAILEVLKSNAKGRRIGYPKDPVTGKTQHHIPMHQYEPLFIEDRVYKSLGDRKYFFTTIRNPWEWHVSSWLYHKNKNKIKMGVIAGQLDPDDYPDISMMPDNDGWIEFETSMEESYKSLDTWLDWMEERGDKRYDEWNCDRNSVITYVRDQEWWLNALRIHSLVVLKIEDHDEIKTFLKNELDISVKEIPVINKLGFGEKTKTYLTPKLKDRINILNYRLIRKYGYEID